MKKCIALLLSTVFAIPVVPVYANDFEGKYVTGETRITLDKNIVEQLSLDKEQTVYSNLSAQEEDERFCDLLDELMDLKIEKFSIENQLPEERDETRLVEIANAMEETRDNIEALGGQTLSNEQVKILMENTKENGMGSRAKPNVPADTTKYDFTSRSATVTVDGKKYPIFHIYVQPKTLGGNLLVNEKAQEEVDNDKYSSQTKDKVVSIYIQKTVSSLIEKLSKYASWLPYEFLYPSDGYSSNVKYRVLMGGVSYTQMDYIYVAAPNTDVYDLIISTGNAEGSIDVVYRQVNYTDKCDTIDWTAKGQYYGDSVQAAIFYRDGGLTNHYYTIKSIKAKIDSQTVFTMGIYTVSSLSSL